MTSEELRLCSLVGRLEKLIGHQIEVFNEYTAIDDVLVDTYTLFIDSMDIYRIYTSIDKLNDYLVSYFDEALTTLEAKGSTQH